MVLELRLNLIAFYCRCARFFFTSDILESWSRLVVEEYNFATRNSLLVLLGLNDFRGDLVSFSNDRVLWKANFCVLAARLMSVPRRPFMWADMYSLQLMFSVHEEPVFFAPVYGCMYTAPGTQNCSVYPHVPLLSRIRQIDGNVAAAQKHFTVVPIFAFNALQFGLLSSENNGRLDVDLCTDLAKETTMAAATLECFRKEPYLQVVVGESHVGVLPFQEGHCASHDLCRLQGATDTAADKESHRCPGCGEGVHAGCGYVNSAVVPIVDSTTCHTCFSKFGKVFIGHVDPDFVPYADKPTEKKKKEGRIRTTKSREIHITTPVVRVHRTTTQLPPNHRLF